MQKLHLFQHSVSVCMHLCVCVCVCVCLHVFVCVLSDFHVHGVVIMIRLYILHSTVQAKSTLILRGIHSFNTFHDLRHPL